MKNPFKVGDTVTLRSSSPFYGQSHPHTGHKSFYTWSANATPTDHDLHKPTVTGTVVHLFVEGADYKEEASDPYVVHVKWLGDTTNIVFVYRISDVDLVEARDPESIAKLIKEMRDEIAKSSV